MENHCKCTFIGELKNYSQKSAHVPGRRPRNSRRLQSNSLAIVFWGLAEPAMGFSRLGLNSSRIIGYSDQSQRFSYIYSLSEILMYFTWKNICVLFGCERLWKTIKIKEEFKLMIFLNICLLVSGHAFFSKRSFISSRNYLSIREHQ